MLFDRRPKIRREDFMIGRGSFNYFLKVLKPGKA